MSTNQKFSSLSGKTILVINTGSIKKKFILQRLKKLGLTIVMLHKEKNWAQSYVDYWILADTANHIEAVRAVDTFIKTNRQVKIDGAITFWEDDVLLASKITDKFNWIGIPYDIAKQARNKFLFREFCQNNGIQSPIHKLIRSTNDIDDSLSFPLVIKPAYGSSSAYVVKVENMEELLDTYNYVKKNMSANIESALYDGMDILVEEYIDGDEVDIDIILQNGKVKFHSISDNYQTEEPFFVETGQAIPSSLPIKNQQLLIDLAEETLEKMGVQNGCIHFEAKSARKGPVPIEINLRMGGDEVYSFVKGAWGVDLIEYGVKIALGMYIEKIKKPDVPRKYINGQYFLSDHSGILAEVDIEEKIHKKNYLEEMHFYKQIGDPVLVPPEGYEYLGWITVSGENFLDAQDNLKEAMQYVSYTVVKFDADSSIGKTSRKNRFSSAVLNKNLLLQAAKMESIRRISKRNLRNLHIGIAYNSKEQSNGNGKAHIDFPYAGETIEKTLKDRGYKVSLFDFNNLNKTMEDLRTTEVDLVFNVSEKINNSHDLKPHVAALLEGMQIPYTGSDAFTLNMCMDKIAVKKLLTYHNIPTPKWDYMYELNDDLRDDLKFPLIVKPAASDSSLGITNQSVVTNKKELHQQIKRVILKMRQPVIIEEYIDGDEYDVSILGNTERDFQVLPLTRSIFKNMPDGYWHIYTYEAKWLKHPAYQHIVLQRPPKNVNRKLEALITEIALDTYSIFDCHDYGRVEVRIDKDNNPYVLELNPNPSLASNMDIPEVAKFLNMDYGNLIEEIIYLAVNRYKNQSLFEQITTS